MLTLILSILLVLGIIYIIPIVIYGLFSFFFKLKMPEGASPARFLFSVLISKIGTAIAFVLIFYLAKETFVYQWLLYAELWLVMFIFGEIGQLIGPTYSKKEAVAGIISETLYFPLSAFVLALPFSPAIY